MIPFDMPTRLWFEIVCTKCDIIYSDGLDTIPTCGREDKRLMVCKKCGSKLFRINDVPALIPTSHEER